MDIGAFQRGVIVPDIDPIPVRFCAAIVDTQSAAFRKCAKSYAGDAGRNTDAGQIVAAGKSLVPNTDNAVGDRHAGQTAAI